MPHQLPVHRFTVQSIILYSLSHFQQCFGVCSGETQAQVPQANADSGAGHVPEEPSGFRWPWQSRAKPGGAVRQQQPRKALSSNPGRTAANTPGRSDEPQLCTGITSAGSLHQHPTAMDQTLQIIIKPCIIPTLEISWRQPWALLVLKARLVRLVA